LSRASLAAAAACVALVAAPMRAGGADEGARALAALRTAAAAERVLKLHAQLGQGLLAQRSRRRLHEALVALDASVRAIGVPASPPELHESAALLAILSAQYRVRAQRPPTRDAAHALGERAEELAWEAGKVARLAMPAPRLALRAEQAAGLAERIGRLVVWQSWGIAPAHGEETLRRARSDLASALAELHQYGEPDAAIDAELGVAENQASFLPAAVAAGDADGTAGEAELLAKASDNAAESLERLSGLLAAARALAR
jgi:hypothetical protein